MMNLLLAAKTAEYATPEIWRVLTKTGYFVGLSGAIGSVVTYVAAVRPALRAESTAPADAAALRRRSAGYLGWAGVVLLVAGYFQLVARVARAGKGMPFGDAMAPGRIADFLNAPAAKGAWIAQGTIYVLQNVVLVATAVALIALFVPAVRRHLDRLALAALPAALAVTLIAGIPATVPAELDRWLDPVFSQLHIVSGVVWLGGLALLVALAGVRGRLGEGAGLLWADIWRRFSLVAMVCVGVVTISGLWITWKHVGAVPQLWTTGYGIALLVKIFLVLGLVTAGAFNQFWLMPRIERARRADDSTSLFHLTLRHFPKVVWGEVVLGVAVLVVLPFIAGSARSEAGGAKAVSDGSIFAAGAALVVALGVSLYATAKVSDALARRPAAVGEPAAT
ncbi:CopD family protein [Kitasatospora sp. NPDC048407]|uniref:CopD family protein n=1 Tax=Kitasatospora sp. NPDC048407 TaxID=3364051 RepID=UPI00370F9440